MCFSFTSNDIVILRKNDYLPKRVVDFPWERDTFRNTIMEIVEDFDEKKLQQQLKTLEIVEDIACESKFLHFSFFFFQHFSPFVRFFHLLFSFFPFFSFFHFSHFFFIFHFEFFHFSIF